MAISETKMQMVIANYFKDECDVNTSIKQAFEKGFRIGVKKGASTDRPQGEWIPNSPSTGNCSECCADGNLKDNYCSNCGARMFAKDINAPNKKGAEDEDN